MSPTLLPAPSRLRLDYLSAFDDVITMVVATKGDEARCPCCNQPSTRVHSHYVRTAADLPWNGVVVRLRLTTRRFFCSNDDCQRKIFTERLPDLIAPYARRTLRLMEALELIGFALGGEAGARALVGLSMQASPDTVLRVIRAALLPERETPRILGVDDFALRRGRTYGTILIDLKRRCRVDVLPDRTAETLATWLEAHPGVEVVSRDRGGAYAEGGRRGAPGAVQVADRFHVLANLREALERLLTRKHHALREAAAALTKEAADETAEQDGPEAQEPIPEPVTRHERQAQERRARRVARYEEVRRLRAKGLSLRAIADRVGLNRQTVQRFVHAETFPERAKRAPYPSIANPYEAYLRRRWEEGCHNATQLWRELREMGFTGSRSGLTERLSRWRATPARCRRLPPGSPSPPAPPAIRPRSPRQASWLLVRSPDDLDTEDQAYLEQLKLLCPEVTIAQPLVQEFGRLVRERDHPALERWLDAVNESDLPDMMSFAAGLRRDRSAVDQMLLTEWSNGQCEGQINRAKLLKRQMYGRAKFDLLRRRILRAA